MERTVENTKSMTAQQLARTIDTSTPEYPWACTPLLAEVAKANDLLIVYGQGDDYCLINGFAKETFGAFRGCKFDIDQKGYRPPWGPAEKNIEEIAAKHFERKKLKRIGITALWCSEDFDPPWTYKTTAMNYAEFNIMEDGEVYCRGLVIDCSELLQGATQ